jgi:hypothetical protein
MIFFAAKNGRTKNVSLSSFGAVVGSGMDKNQEHWLGFKFLLLLPKAKIVTLCSRFFCLQGYLKSQRA